MTRFLTALFGITALAAVACAAAVVVPRLARRARLERAVARASTRGSSIRQLEDIAAFGDADAVHALATIAEHERGLGFA